MEPLRILMVHNFYQIGGGEHIVFENEAALLREHGNTVFTYTKDNAVLKQSKLRLACMPFTTLWSISTYRDVVRLIRQEKIQIVHCHNTFPLVSPSVYYAAWKCHVPVVQTVHNFRFVCPNGLLFREGHNCEECLAAGPLHSIRHRCYRGSRLQTVVAAGALWLHRTIGTYRRLNYIFLTAFNRDKMVTVLQPAGKVFLKPNFVHPDPVLLDIPVQDNRFIYVGRLDGYKGFPFLMDFFAAHPQWELYAFGTGEYEAQARSLASTHANLHIMGFQSHEAMQKMWQSSCALVFASECYEGQPMTIAESFALKTPVITTAIGNQQNMVTPGVTGEPFRLHDAASLEQAIRKVQKNREQYESGLQAAAEVYSSGNNYNRLMQVYAELLGGRDKDNAK